ncbi:MAG: Hint domain-containing protein [Litoreibacter sp.]|uniref:Hint domain-containing protein n=1 Tax=Litoreibacter sp. TaxID=1969459 RepID=UPI0032977743
MAYSPDPHGYPQTSHVGSQRSAMYRAPSRARTRAATRPFNISWLCGNDDVHYDTVTAPSLPVIDAACGNIARGSLISTLNGPVAVEDLTPGMMVMTSEYGPVKLLWMGSYEMSLRDAQTTNRGSLYRVTTDAFGLTTPMQDTLLAPRSHILFEHPKCQDLLGVDKAFAPIRAFEDGDRVFPVQPVAPVEVFNLSFERQASVLVNGLEIECFHPGPYAETLIDRDTLSALMTLFPQAGGPEFFGTQLIKRLTAFEVGSLRKGA